LVAGHLPSALLQNDGGKAVGQSGIVAERGEVARKAFFILRCPGRRRKSDAQPLADIARARNVAGGAVFGSMRLENLGVGVGQVSGHYEIGSVGPEKEKGEDADAEREQGENKTAALGTDGANRGASHDDARASSIGQRAALAWTKCGRGIAASAVPATFLSERMAFSCSQAPPFCVGTHRAGLPFAEVSAYPVLVGPLVGSVLQSELLQTKAVASVSLRPVAHRIPPAKA
jgi:hypothetical protein